MTVDPHAGEALWYESHHCSHAHCPNDCEHPQPFLAADGRLLCGRCSVYGQQAVEMLPCDEDLCA
jgi:hypothetical protein